MYNVSFSFSNRAQELNDNSTRVPNQYFLLTDLFRLRGIKKKNHLEIQG